MGLEVFILRMKVRHGVRMFTIAHPEVIIDSSIAVVVELLRMFGRLWRKFFFHGCSFPYVVVLIETALMKMQTHITVRMSQLKAYAFKRVITLLVPICINAWRQRAAT